MKGNQIPMAVAYAITLILTGDLALVWHTQDIALICHICTSNVCNLL